MRKEDAAGKRRKGRPDAEVDGRHQARLDRKGKEDPMRRWMDGIRHDLTERERKTRCGGGWTASGTT